MFYLDLDTKILALLFLHINYIAYLWRILKYFSIKFLLYCYIFIQQFPYQVHGIFLLVPKKIDVVGFVPSSTMKG